MSYVYHHVPKNLGGNTIYPLNSLKDIYPDVYEHEAKKYVGREHVPQQRISLFNACLWNDVLFFTAVNPSEIFEARREAGWPDMGPSQYFKLDPNSLNQANLGVFLFQPTADPKNYTPDNFTEYNYENLNQYSRIPKETKEYYKHEFEAGEPYIKLLYRYIPHVLYRGAIDISDTEIIEVN